jgi:AraC-like DNA-binding protein/mannose-6-phosphate isomerase-like protein (cupin superfamily)
MYFAFSAMATLPPIRISDHFGAHALQAWSGGFVTFDHAPTNHPHLHTTYHELCLVLQGHGTFLHADRTYALAPGTLFFSELNTVHEISSHRSRNLRLVFCCLSLRQTPAADEQPRAQARILAQFAAGHRLLIPECGFLADYVPLMSRGGTTVADRLRREEALRLFVLEGLSSLATTSPGREYGTAPEPVQRAVAYIERNVHTPFTVSQLAAACFCSERHLRRLFLERTGKRLARAVNERRMHLAAQQLLMRFSVARVAEAFGISSVAHFSRQFRRVHGLSPKQYQQRHAPGPALPGTVFRPGDGNEAA